MFAAAKRRPAHHAARLSGLFASATPNRVPPSLTHTHQNAHERKTAPFVSSSLRTLFPAPNLQPSSFHALAHSFAHRKNITLSFPVTSAPFVRSLARVQHSTPLFSCACALFREKWGCHEKFGPHLDCQSLGLSTNFTIFTLPDAKPRRVSKRVATRLNRVGRRSALPALRVQTLCYALRLDEFSPVPSSEVPCES